MNFLKMKNTAKPAGTLPAQAFKNQAAVWAFFIGVGLTTYFYGQAYRLESDSLRSDIKGYTQDVRQALESEMLSNLSTLRALRSFFAASHEVNAAEFGIFAEHIFNLYPTIDTLEWVPRVLKEDISQFKSQARKGGIVKPELFRWDETGGMTQPGDKKEYFPCLFAEPFETSFSTIGFDHSSEEARRAAMARSADIDDISATPILKVFRIIQGEHTSFRGVAAYLPVFASDASRRHSPRPSQLLKGYLVAVFKVDDLVRVSTKRFKSSDTAIRIYAADPDSDAPWNELLNTAIESPGSRLRNTRPSRLVQRMEFSVAGGLWAVECEREENPFGIGHRTSSALLLVGILSSLLLALILVMIERRKTQALVTEWSIRDELTGLYNRRGFLLFAEERMRLSERNRSGLWLVVADLDYLKRINDTFGHAEGDKVLVRAGRILKDACRETDIVARVGGDEFAALVFESDENGREAILERISARISEDSKNSPKDQRVSLSIGAAFTAAREQLTLDALFREADAELYRAKAARPVKR